jgi:hypothetical protein
LIETAIVLPLYMILIYGLLYFGYATLGRQRQDKATAYSAWQSALQQAGPLVSQFWGWNEPGSGSVSSAPPNSNPSAASAGDTNFCVYGGSVNGQWIRPTDEYYGMTINGTVFIPDQLANGVQLPGKGGADIFDRERVAVDLWNYALGATTQSFNWVPGQGIVQQFNTNYTDFARYLNLTPNPQGGLLLADAVDPPTSALTLSPGWGWRITTALDGPSGGGLWLQRRAVESTMAYNDPLFVRYAYAEQGAPPSTFAQYISGNNTAPANTSWMTATMDCDVTVRNTASVRQGAEEAPQTAAGLLTQVAGFFGQPDLPAPNSMDSQILNSSGVTIQDAWTPW